MENVYHKLVIIHPLQETTSPLFIRYKEIFTHLIALWWDLLGDPELTRQHPLSEFRSRSDQARVPLWNSFHM